MKTKRSVRGSEISATRKKNAASRDRIIRRRLVAALDGSDPLRCTKRETRAICAWAGERDVSTFERRSRMRVVAHAAIAKALGMTPAQLALMGGWYHRPKPPGTVLVIEDTAHWAYDVVEVGPAAIELRYTGASAERETRMFRRHDGVAIDDPKVRIAPEDLARLTGLGGATDAAMKQGLGGERPVKDDPLAPFAGRTSLVIAEKLAAMFSPLWLPEHKRGVAAIAQALEDAKESAPLSQPKDGPDIVEKLDHMLAKHGVPIDRHDIHAQIDAWTTEALQGLAPRVSARVWQAYRAGQGQSGGSYSEAGHELAAQEAERLRALVEKLERFRALDSATIRALGDKLATMETSLLDALKERDTARAELAKEQHRHRETEGAAREIVRVLEGERDAARAEAKIAETSLVTTAKERDDAADALRELSAQLQERADQWAKAIVDKSLAQQERDTVQKMLERTQTSLARCIDDLNDAVNDRDAARAELADLRAGISALTSGRAA